MKNSNACHKWHAVNISETSENFSNHFSPVCLHLINLRQPSFIAKPELRQKVCGNSKNVTNWQNTIFISLYVQCEIVSFECNYVKTNSILCKKN